ncbi:hypothetical protein ACPC54_39810 [Kitasatospora sp. NPDC094028]
MKSNTVPTRRRPASGTRPRCLYRLGEHHRASNALLRALPDAAEPASVLFDIGLNALRAGDVARARDAYRKGLAEVARMRPMSARAPLSVAVTDLRNARLGPAEPAECDEYVALERQLGAALAERPLPDGLLEVR